MTYSMDFRLRPSANPVCWSFARALARRLATPYAQYLNGTVFTVMPFGMGLISDDSTTWIERSLTTGITVNYINGSVVSNPFIAGVLSGLEILLGSSRRWRWQPEGRPDNTHPICHYTIGPDGDAPEEVPADPRTIVAGPSVVHIPMGAFPIVAFDPLAAGILDAKYAATTPDGRPRDWLAELREYNAARKAGKRR